MFYLFKGRYKKAGLAICGYVDDGLLIIQSKNKSYSATTIYVAFALVEEWAHKNSMIFDPEKFKAIHFSRKRCFLSSEIVLPLAFQMENGTGMQIIKYIQGWQ